MTMWGRIIGAILGFRLLGILGGIFGYLVGLWFEQGLRLHLYRIPRSQAVSIQQAFFRATFLVMGNIAKARGHVSENAIRIAEKVMSRLELNEELRREAVRLFTEGKDPNFDLHSVLSNLRSECRRYPDLLRFFIEIQLEIALANGELRSKEKAILLFICQELHFSPQEFEHLRERQRASQAFHGWFTSQFDEGKTHYSQREYASNRSDNRRYASNGNSLNDAYGVLGVSISATNMEIKKAYRRLMNQHHPDKLAARGLPEGMVKLAKEKTQQIRAAYDLIRKERNFR
jgi:DnaJ like chaperone protein